ncbi:unnamed protein product [Lasius platythorax]|uniref:CCHC-type domain-containing protein n=1 Tax=Lasius platythorax TaxID=488582 RepID=A0AAV2MZ05_9HYME
MAAQNPPRITRSRAAVNETSETDALQAALQELREMRNERDRQQARFEALLQEKDDQLRQLQQRISSQQNNQLSPSNNRDRACGDTQNNFGACASTARAATNVSAATNASDVTADFRAKTGLKLKPDTYDGKVPLREFLSQFLLIAIANNWDDKTKTISLAANLRGKARTVLENVENFEELTFAELKSKLELLFGDGNLTQNYYSLFTNRKQKYGKDFASFGAELERLSRLAYPECPFTVRNKIACAQFVSALSDNFVKRTLQLEGITSLNLAIERGKAIKIIREENFERNKRDFENNRNKRDYENNGNNGNNAGFNKNHERQNFQKGERNHARTNSEKKKEHFDSKGKAQANNFSSKGKECWSCGKTGHLRFQCPDAKGN